MEPRLVTPSFVGLAVANFASSMIFYLLVPTMASHAVTRFGASPLAAGTLASIFFVGALLARLVGGWLVDRFGSRRVAIAAAGLYLVTTAAYVVAPTLPVMMVVRILNGAGFGLLGSALISGVMLTFPARRRAEGAGWFAVGIAVSVGLGPWLALTLAEAAGMTAVFVVATSAVVLALALILIFSRGLPGPRNVDAPPPLTLGSLLERRVLGLGGVILLSSFCYSSVLAFLDPATQGTDLAGVASWYFLAYALVILVWRPAAGRIQDRRGEASLLVPSFVIFFASMAVLAAATTGGMLLLSAVLLGFGFGSVTTGGQAAAVTRIPRERTGAAVATHFVMLDLGTALGPMVLGGLVPSLGFGGVYWVAAALTALTAPLYLLDLRRHRRTAAG